MKYEIPINIPINGFTGMFLIIVILQILFYFFTFDLYYGS